MDIVHTPILDITMGLVMEGVTPIEEVATGEAITMEVDIEVSTIMGIEVIINIIALVNMDVTNSRRNS